MPLTVPNRDDWFQESHDFPRPDWRAIDGWMRAFACPEEIEDAWYRLTQHWLGRLRERLGGDYTVAESANFHLLSELPAGTREKLLSFLEAGRSQIRTTLGEVAGPELRGKHVVMRFSDADDYYPYIAHFHPDGEYAGSGGMFLRDGYYHVAYPQSWGEQEERATLIHELTHNLVAHLPLPFWLNESLAMGFETDIAGSRLEACSRELAGRHREYWTPRTIQEFWRGESFSDVEGQELAYSLARILLNLVQTELRPTPEEFRRFVRRADWSDAGAIAVREHLDIELADLAACFLGPGDWGPQPLTSQTGDSVS